MKKLICNILMYVLVVFALCSCEKMFGNFLDKAPGVDITEDDVFSSRAKVETLLASVYDYGVHSNLGYGSGDHSNPVATLLAGACDEAETCAPWYYTNSWNAGSVTPDNPCEGRWSLRWIAIRKAALLIDRINEVPDVSEELARQMIAECKVVRAMNYFEMMKIYGGVPIVDHYITVEEAENLKIMRSSLKEVLNFILKDIREALPDLEARSTGSRKGHVDKGTALAIKSKALLFAASPLFNTDKPYLPMPRPEDNTLICMGSYDPALWEEAASAAAECLVWAEENGCALITDQGENANYRYAWEQYDNDEIIFAEKSHGMIGKWTWPWSPIPSPNIYPGNAGQSGVTPTLNFVRLYEKRDGTPQTWEGGDDLQEKMSQLDFRFGQTICGNKSSWNSEFSSVDIYEGGRHSTTCYGGFWLRKPYPSAISSNVWQYVPNSTLYQLNEIYLNFAEAMNEAYGASDSHGYSMNALQAINAIRTRSGQPELKEGMSKEEFRAKLVNERAIEMAFDAHRFYDVRRWMIAETEGILKGNMYGIKISKIPGNNSEFHYEPYVFESRTFSKKFYLHPFPTNEINKGYLVQNPGY